VKNGTLYAVRLKKFFSKLRQAGPKPEVPDVDDPIRRLAIAMLGIEGGEAEGFRLVDKLMTVFVDWNDVRVSRPIELARAIGVEAPAMVERCQHLITALNAVYRQENKTSLDRLRGLGRREARQYLEKLPGMDVYAVASVFLWSLGGHAIPVSNAAWNTLKRNDLVDPGADRSEIQAFLERNISATDAKEFCLMLGAQPSGRRAAVTKSKAASGGRSTRAAAGGG
jgi:endonuclease III